ncbi:MAG: hypothetical protein J7647_00685 [Cyanobacteria bacterium SBLK]|nr:hypothetical protein [Cyanobacteria bacterium SBLK]
MSRTAIAVIASLSYSILAPALTKAETIPEVVLPNAIAREILEDANKLTELPTSEMQITRAFEVAWPNGCVGLSRGGGCTRAIVVGWIACVKASHEGSDRHLIYHVANPESKDFRSVSEISEFDFVDIYLAKDTVQDECLEHIEAQMERGLTSSACYFVERGAFSSPLQIQQTELHDSPSKPPIYKTDKPS